MNMRVRWSDGYEVGFVWDTGDPSVGLWPGWEECWVSRPAFTIMGAEFNVGFTPVMDSDPSTWKVDQLWVSKGRKVTEVEMIPEREKLAYFKKMCDRVRAVWDYIEAVHYIEACAEDVNSYGDWLWSIQHEGLSQYDDQDLHVRVENERRWAVAWYNWAYAAYQREWGEWNDAETDSEGVLELAA